MRKGPPPEIVFVLQRYRLWGVSLFSLYFSSNNEDCQLYSISHSNLSVSRLSQKERASCKYDFLCDSLYSLTSSNSQNKISSGIDHSRKEVRDPNRVSHQKANHLMASDKGQGKRRRTTDSAEGSRRLPQGVFQPFPKIPATPTWVQKKKKLAWPQGNALATLKIIIRRRQRKGFPVSHQGVREVSFFLSYSI